MNTIVSTVVPRPAFGKKKKKMSEAPKTTQCQKIRLKIMKNKQYLLTIKPTISNWNQCRCILSCGDLDITRLKIHPKMYKINFKTMQSSKCKTS